MKRMLPVDELARDERFQHMRIEEVVFDPRNANNEARRTNGLAPDYANSSDNARALMHGIFVGEIQALEGAGRTCCDFDTGDGRGAGPVRAQARHGPPVLGRGPPRRDLRASSAEHMGTEIGEFAEQTMLYEAACNADPVLRLTGVNRALEGLAIDVFKTMRDFGDTLQRPGALLLRGLDAGRRGHPREDGLRLAAPPHGQRSGAPEAGPRLPEGRRQAVQLRRLPRRGARRTRCTWPASSAGWPASPTTRSPSWSTSPPRPTPRRRRRLPTRRRSRRRQPLTLLARPPRTWLGVVRHHRQRAGRPVGARRRTGCRRCAPARCGGSPAVVRGGDLRAGRPRRRPGRRPGHRGAAVPHVLRLRRHHRRRHHLLVPPPAARPAATCSTASAASS